MFINNLKEALFKTSNKISSGIDLIFFKKKLDDAALENLEELLIMSDIDVSTSQTIINNFKNNKFSDQVTVSEVKAALSSLVAQILLKTSHHFELNTGLNVVLVCGVNGSGKTTTIGKLAHLYSKLGKKIVIAACDTFRAAAVQQLESWSLRTGALFVSGDKAVDPASVAYQGMITALEHKADILFIDTAGRLHNQKNLMDELGKILRVVQKVDLSAPHHKLLILDGNIGQNSYAQVLHFNEVVKLTGLIITKLDGSSKAGSVIAINQKFSLPIYFIGVGEGVEDLKYFDPENFAKALVGNNIVI